MSVAILNSTETLTSETKTSLSMGIVILFIILLSLDSFIKKKFSEKSKLYNRFPIKFFKVKEEIAELMHTRAFNISEKE